MKFILIALGFFGFVSNLNAQVPEGKTVISSLYVYDMSTGQSNLVTRELRHLEAPNW